MKGKMHAIDATFDTEPDFVQTNHPQSRSLSIFSFSLHFLSLFISPLRSIHLSPHFLILSPFSHSLSISSFSPHFLPINSPDLQRLCQLEKKTISTQETGTQISPFQSCGFQNHNFFLIVSYFETRTRIRIQPILYFQKMPLIFQIVLQIICLRDKTIP